MGLGSGLYIYDVVKRSRSLSHLLMSSCQHMWGALWIVNSWNFEDLLKEFWSFGGFTLGLHFHPIFRRAK